MTRSLALLFALVWMARPLDAQVIPARAGIEPVPVVPANAGLVIPARLVPAGPKPKTGIQSRSASATTSSPWAIAASAVLPGSGQAMLQVNRALPYLAIEAFAWTAYVRHSQRYRARRDDYRGLAARVARAPYSTIAPNGDFAYYERMTHYAESGRYDLVAGGRIDPETDSTTYNGSVWLLARRTYWSDPTVAPDTLSSEWQRAVSFYQSRAYDNLYRWSWSQAPREYRLFADFIRKSNDANRRAMMDLGVVIANHVLSTVDAYITVRLRHDRSRNEFGFHAQLPLRWPGSK